MIRPAKIPGENAKRGGVAEGDWPAMNAETDHNGEQKPDPHAIGVSSRSGVAPPIQTRWKPGQSGNPTGHRSAGASVREWWNQMQGWPLKKIEAVMEMARAPVTQKIAARALIDAASQDKTNAGMPIAGADLDRIIEHTAGRAKQVVDVKLDGHFAVSDTQRLMGKLLADPDAFEAAASLSDRITEHGPGEN